MKKFISLLLVFVFMFCLTGCAKEVSRREFTTKVEITDTYHTGFYLQPIKSGSVTTFISHPERNYVYVTYEDIEYQIDNEEYYEYCKDHIGDIIFAIFDKVSYDDGTYRYILKDLNIE